MNMVCSRKLLICVLPVVLSACASDGSFDGVKATAIGVGVLAAAALDEDDVKQAASLSAKELDSKSLVATESSPYAKRLASITTGLHNYAGLKLDFKVYIAKDINAFAMADGTVRVYSGLLDAMPDDQVLAVIGHEIGHVKLKHSYRQMREQMLTNTAFQAIASAGGTIGQLTSSELGAIAYQAVNARFSQKDELESDQFAVKMLRSLGKDPNAMLRAVETLESLYGSGGGFLSSHPSNSQRKDEITKAIGAS
jgi:putative metalloprotease